MESPETNSTTNYELSKVNTNEPSVNPDPRNPTNYQPKDIEPIKQKLEEVKNICVDNIDKVLQRGEKIELLVDQSEKLQTSSHNFQKTARGLRNAMLYRKIRWYVCLVVLSALGIYILSWIICGNASLKECR